MKKLLLILLVLGAFIIPNISAETKLLFEVGLEQVPGWSFIHKFGHLEDVATTEMTIWSNGTIYPFLDAATLFNLSSTDIDDDLFDTGAWNITIEGLDADYVRLNETVVLDGQTPVSTVNNYLRIQRMYVRKSGISESNEGTIYAGTGPTVGGKPLNVYAVIDPDTATRFTGYGQTHMAVYTIPANKTGLLCNILLSSFQKKSHEFYFMIKPFNESWRRIEELHFESFTFQQFHEPCFPIEAKTDIMMTVIGESAGGAVSVSFDLILVDDGFEVIPDEAAASNNMLLYLLLIVVILLVLGSKRK